MSVHISTMTVLEYEPSEL